MTEITVGRRRPHGLWLRLVINAVAIFLTGKLISGVEVDGILGALIAAAILALVNTFVRPVLLILTLPVTIVTLGLFILVVNGLSLLLAAWLAGGLFDIHGLGPAILAWLVFAFLNWVISTVMGGDRVIVTRE